MSPRLSTYSGKVLLANLTLSASSSSSSDFASSSHPTPLSTTSILASTTSGSIFLGFREEEPFSVGLNLTVDALIASVEGSFLPPSSSPPTTLHYPFASNPEPTLLFFPIPFSLPSSTPTLLQRLLPHLNLFPLPNHDAPPLVQDPRPSWSRTSSSGLNLKKKSNSLDGNVVWEQKEGSSKRRRIGEGRVVLNAQLGGVVLGMEEGWKGHEEEEREI